MLAVTVGEPSGIGPDLIVQICQHERAVDWVAVGCAATLTERAQTLNLPLQLHAWSDDACSGAGELSIIDVPCPAPVTAGQLNVANAQAVVDMLRAALSGIESGRLAGMVTAPVQKSIINEAGLVFSGHTEFLRDHAGVEDVVMMLASGDFRVALATTHLPLREVAEALTQPLLVRRINILHADLKARFRIDAPCIALTGLNPHAGESGYLGREEIEIIEPVAKRLRAEGKNILGPLPADTLFTSERLVGVDCVMAMYHDQGLPVLKYAGFGEAVNVTLGLPFVRTSVDHGTALDIAGTGQAHTGSLLAAIDMAAELCRVRS